MFLLVQKRRMLPFKSMSFREELIGSIREKGDPQPYRASLDTLPPSIVGMRGKVSSLCVHPLKGAGGIELRAARLGETGLETMSGRVRDRMAMVVRMESGWSDDVGDYAGTRVSLKDTPHLARIHFEHYCGNLVMSAPGDSGFSYEFDPREFAPREGRLQRILYTGSHPEVVTGTLLKGNVVATLLRMLAYFGENVENLGILVPHPEFSRPSDTRDPADEKKRTTYSDGSQLHVINKDTVAFVNQRIQERHGNARTISERAYRPNIELLGFPANVEDLARDIQIFGPSGAANITLTGFTPRCVVPTRHTRTGAIDGGEPLTSLAAFRPRRPWDGKTTFGANADATPASTGKGAVISVGNVVEVLSEKTTWR